MTGKLIMNYICPMIKMKKFILLFMICWSFSGWSQTDSGLVQFSGLVVSADSLRTLPFVAIKNTRNKIIALTDYEGFFSMAAKKGDTVYFSLLGFERTRYILPKELPSNRFSIVQVMNNDTIYLSGATIRPFPKAKDVFYELEHGTFQDDALANAQKNLSKENNDRLSVNLNMDGGENYKAYMNQQYQRYYYMGQTPPARILDPLAWNEFFNYWKAGKFKKKN